MTARLDLTKPLSAAMLEAAGACPAAVALVRQHFGSRPFPLTRERLRQAARLGLEVSWLATHLPLEQRRVYAASEAEARRVYDAAMAEAWRGFDAALAEPWRVFDASEAEAERVYVAAMDEARRVFYAARADALADALGLP